MAAVAAKKDVFDELGVEILAVSTDSQFTHQIWQQSELSKMVDGGFPYPMLADRAGDIGKLFGVYEEAAGVDIRGRFIIDPDGIVQAMEILTPPVGRNVAEFVRQIEAFQHVRNSGGKEVCPAGWTKGDKTLVPRPSLVGNVWKEWKPTE